MSITIESGGWTRASGPFWHAKKPVLHTDGPVRLKNRGGSPQVVAVYNPARKDFRIKVFADPLIASTIMSVDGRAFTFTVYPDKSLGQARIASDVLWRILQGIDPWDDKLPDEDVEQDPAAPQYLDLSIEARFDGDDGRWYQMKCGQITRAPDWLGVTKIAVSEAYRGGGWHGLLVRIDPKLKHFYQHYRSSGGDLPCMLRVNGHWMLAHPYGQPGEWMLSGDPRDVALIRERDPAERPDPVHEPAPLWDRAAVRKLHKAVRLSNAEYNDGCAAASTLAAKFMGLCSWQGQQDYWSMTLNRIGLELKRTKGLLEARYNRRANAYKAYEIDEWVSEVGGKPREWLARITDLNKKYIPRAQGRYDDYQEGIDKMRAAAEEAEATLGELAEKYADAVRYLFKPRQR